MKRLGILLLLPLFLFIGCPDTSSIDTPENVNQKDDDKQTESTKTPSDSEKEQTDSEQNKAYVSLQNDSQFRVEVYTDSLRENKLCSLNQTESYKTEAEVSVAGAVYYLTYFVNVGVEIPWYNTNSYIVASPKTGETVAVSATDPQSMKQNACFMVVENQSAYNLIIKRGSSELFSETDKTSTVLSAESSGVYKIESSQFGNFSTYKIYTVQGSEIPLPSNFTAFSSGDIYTVTVTNSGASLKSVSPFDVDTQKQIWNLNDSTFLVDSNYVYARPVMRSAYTVSEGSLVLGTLKTDATKIGLMAVDVYGNKSVVGTATFSESTYGTLLESAVLDFTEQSDGTVVMILENASTLNDETLWYEMLVCYNFSTNTLVWSLTFQQLYASYMASAIGTDAFYIDFYSETANTLCRMKDNMIAVVGAADTGEAMYPFFTVIDATPYVSAESEQFTVHNYLATAAQATGDAQSYFTAVYYDGADFYVSGFSNCDFTYEDMTYMGTIYQFSGDLATAQKLYEKERYLFLCIDGVGKNWYACGEYCDTGTILKGCYISSDMVSANTAPSLHVSKNSYCWFDQLCCYNGKIILYGTTSADKAGEDSPLPFVASYTASGSLLWENTSYTKYTQAYSLIPNAIGTYVLQLSGSARSSLHYVSADLLGNE